MLGFKASRHCHWRGSKSTTFLNPWYNDIKYDIWYILISYEWERDMILYMIINMATGASPTTWNGCLIHIPTYFGSDVPRPRRHDYCQELLHSWPWSEKTLGDALSWVPGVKPLDMARAEFKNIRDVLENTHEGLVVWGWWVQNPHHIWVYYPFPRKFNHPLNETIVFCWEFPHSIGTMQFGVFNIRVMWLYMWL